MTTHRECNAQIHELQLRLTNNTISKQSRKIIHRLTLMMPWSSVVKETGISRTNLSMINIRQCDADINEFLQLVRTIERLTGKRWICS